jgi:hypothetical protein
MTHPPMTRALARGGLPAVVLAVLAGSTFAQPRPAAAAVPQLVKGPYLTGLTSDSVDVRFELDAPAAATVEFSAEEDAGAPRAVQDTPVSMHEVHVAGLEPAKAYTYVVRPAGGAPASPLGHFVTAPRDDSDAPIRFLLYGDDRSDVQVHAALVRAMTAIPSDFLVNTGDIVADGGNPLDWQSFFDVEGALLRDRALFLCIGNHELYDDEAGSRFARYFGYPDASGTLRPYGTMRWSNARFFFLNGMHDWTQGPERAWLEKALADADHEAALFWRFVVVHHGAWSSGPHGENRKLDDAGIPELLAKHGVDLVLSGHDHVYERGSAALKYVISGGGGAKLYTIDHPIAASRKAEASYHFVEMRTSANRLSLTMHRLDGTIGDTCGFEHGKDWDCDGSPGAAAASPTATGGTSPGDASRTASSRGKCGCALPGAGGPAAWTERGGWSAIVAGLAAIVARRLRRRA